MKLIINVAVFIVATGYSFVTVAYVPAQVKLFKKAIQSSTKIANCADCDFRGVQELAGLDAHGAHMPGVTFQPCTPSEDNKSNSLMICVADQVSDLTGMNLANLNAFSSCWDKAILDNADLSGADFTNSSLQGVSLKNAKVSGMITENATFCKAIMPDGAICTDTWTGQGITVECRCVEKK